jgi:MGT family glycosyltransferase
MRVLFPIHSGHGHVQQMIPLALAFQGAGHDVRVVCERRMAGFIESAGLVAVPLYENTRHPMPTEELAATAKVGLERLLDYAGSQWRPDVVIREWAEMAGLVVAVELGVPCVVCGRKIRPAPSHAGAHPCLGLMESGIEQILSAKPTREGFSLDLSKVAARHARLTKRQDGGLSATLDPSTLFGDLFLSFYPPSVSFPDAQPLPSEHHFQPPIFDRLEGEPTPPWLAELTDKPIVFTTLGTTINQVGGVFENIIEATAPLDVHLVAAVGPDRDPARLGRLPDNVHVARYIPSSQIMPRCAAAIVHGGFSTTMTALTYGVPLVCIPVYGDQPVNAQRCVELGLALSYTDGAPTGIGLEPDRLDVGRLRAMVESVLREPSFAAAAGRIAADIKALPPIDAAVPLVTELVATAAD